MSAENIEVRPEAQSEAQPPSQQGESTAVKDIIDFVIKRLSLFIVAIVLAIVLFILNRHKLMPMYKKLMISLAPIVLITIYYFFKFSPSPIGSYVVSRLTTDQGFQTGFEHITKGSTWPFLASAVIEIGNKTHIFLGGGQDQDDVLLIYDNETKQFNNVIDSTNLNKKTSATYCAVAFDMNNNGLDDLIVGREDGITLYLQNNSKKFKAHKIFSSDDRVPLALSVSDYNKDGKPDIYISFFTRINKYKGTIFNDPTHDRENVLLKNTSNGNEVSFVDVTKETNSAGSNNTFTSAFVDLNNNGWPDLVLSNDSGYVEILKNNKGKFESFNAYPQLGNWMGLGVGDINNNGYQDLFLTNIGTDMLRAKVSVGDLKLGQKQTFSHVLLRNDGDYKFKDVLDEKKISGKGFGWGAVIEDLNLDGKQDVLFGENFLLEPTNFVFPGVGYYYEQNKIDNFGRKFKYNNPHFAQTPLLVDFNNDGIKDIVWVNVKGPTIAYIRDKTGNYINVKLPKNVDFVNCKIILDTNDKKMHRENIHGGVGFGSGQSDLITFGLGNLNKIKDITIKTIYGKVYKAVNPQINKTLTLSDFKSY